MSDAADAPAQPPVEPPPSALVTTRSDPGTLLLDLHQLADFIDKLRASGVKTFEHPCGLRLSFEPGGKLPAIRPSEGW
jgi:hypothetical protein